MATSRMIFVNLPVRDVDASIDYFRQLGFEFDPRFSDKSCACMIVSEEHSYVMLLERTRFADFTAKPVADAHTATEVAVCVSAESREGVDELADAGLRAGGSPAQEPMDYGFMYGRSFHDPDGHLWEVNWMDPVAIEQGPAAIAESA